jgi:hypothetical protein
LDADRGPGSSPIDNQIEADIRGRSADQRQAVRQHKTRPLIAALKTWLEKTLTQLPGASEIAKAVRYALNQGDGLTRFLDDGRIEIDSNSIERAMRPVALTRKNSLCAGSNDGAENWAMLASLIEIGVQAEPRQSGGLLHRCADQARQQLAQPPPRRIAALGLEPRSTLIRQAPIPTVLKQRLWRSGRRSVSYAGHDGSAAGHRLYRRGACPGAGRPTPALADRWHRVDQLLKEAAVVNVCRGNPQSQRDTVGIGDNVALRSGSAAIGRIGAGLFAPLLPGRTRCPRRHGSDRLRAPRPSGPAERDAACSRPRWRTNRAAAASTSSPNRNPSPGEHLPGNAALQHKQDAAQHRPVWQGRPTAFRSEPLHWQQRFDNGPQLIGYKGLGRTPQNSTPLPPFQVLLAALNPTFPRLPSILRAMFHFIEAPCNEIRLTVDCAQAARCL